MELIFELLFEFFGELIVQLVFEALAEAGIHLVRHPEHDAPPPAAWKLVLGYTLFGLIVGGISLLVFPDSFVRARPARLANLLLAPLASGLAMELIGAWRRRRQQRVFGLDRFAYGYIFALAMALVRFHWAN